MKLEKKHYIWGGIILALILIYIFRNQLMNLFGINSNKRIYAAGGNIGGGLPGGGNITPGGGGSHGGGSAPAPVARPGSILINPGNVYLRSCDWLDYYLQSRDPKNFPLNCGSHSGSYRSGSHVIIPSDANDIYNRCVERGVATPVCNGIRKIVEKSVGKSF